MVLARITIIIVLVLVLRGLAGAQVSPSPVQILGSTSTQSAEVTTCAGIGCLATQVMVMPPVVVTGIQCTCSTPVEAIVTCTNGASVAVFAADSTRCAYVLTSEPTNILNITIRTTAVLDPTKGFLIYPSERVADNSQNALWCETQGVGVATLRTLSCN